MPNHDPNEQVAYRMWWLAEWMKGGKTGRQIDEEVEAGELTPKFPPDWPEQTEAPTP